MITIDNEQLVTVAGGVTMDPEGRSCTDPRPTRPRPLDPFLQPFPRLPNPLPPMGRSVLETIHNGSLGSLGSGSIANPRRFMR